MPLSTADLRARIAAEPWTSHNVRLNDEVTTMPGEPDFLATDLRLLAILRVLDLFFGPNLAGLRAADLGCLEGGFSLALAQRGVETLGIEARRRNLAKARLLREHFELPNLNFELGDVKEFRRQSKGEFDIVLALGILYHLDRPMEWLKQIAETTRRVLILDTHYAPAFEEERKRLDPTLPLGPLVNMDNFQGRWFREYGDDADREHQLWASYSNQRSFWMTKESLLLNLLYAGFPLVFEQHDYSAGFYHRTAVTHPRTMLIALKPGAVTRV
jgi:SAM-dependent methyltransferase